MAIQQKSSKIVHISLWAAQVILAVFLISGAIMKFLPIEKISVMMPWTGEIPKVGVRFLGVIDLLGAIGLILPSLLRIKPQVTPWAAVCIILLMFCAIVFHISRGETAVIGVNIFCIVIAGFITWGDFGKQ